MRSSLAISYLTERVRSLRINIFSLSFISAAFSCLPSTINDSLLLPITSLVYVYSIHFNFDFSCTTVQQQRRLIFFFFSCVVSLPLELFSLYSPIKAITCALYSDLIRVSRFIEISAALLFHGRRLFFPSQLMIEFITNRRPKV